ncbi:hypothetical protein SJI19_16920 [Acerihabitans sp. TG2]|uniref:hypothetical protein n=1 Tax=Acerihabitans sp. TG2 TaxID=3096008 RepID=UPI002B22B772|nr:hypothetical protein [Acerihabitans sp. TG2]MEA9392209.1 hypothetical protein [Acerihabitans sp. TG2]
MKLWILKARDEDLTSDDNPWEQWYDTNFGLLIRAESEDRARELAQAEACDEKRGSPWLDAKYSTCYELTNDGGEGVLLIDNRGA